MKLWQGGGLSIKPHCWKGKNDSLFWTSAQSKPSVSKLAAKQRQRSISTVSSYFRFPKITQRPSTFSTTLSQKKVEERREDTYKWRINSKVVKNLIEQFWFGCWNWTVRMQPLPLQLWAKMRGRDFLRCSATQWPRLHQVKSSWTHDFFSSFFFSATLAGGLIDPSNQSWGQHDHDKCGLMIRMDVGQHPKSSCCCQEPTDLLWMYKIEPGSENENLRKFSPNFTSYYRWN